MNRRDFTFGLLTATALAGVSGAAKAQGAIPAMEYIVMANKGGKFLEETARSAFDRAQDPTVRRFSRAEVVEQVNLQDKFAASGATPPAASAPGGLVGAAIGAPFAIAGGALGAAGAAFGWAPGPMTSDAQKAQLVSSFQSMPPGPAYDAAFVQAQLVSHQEALAIHGSYAQSGDDPMLRRIARGALPLIRLHIAQLTRMSRMFGPVG